VDPPNYNRNIRAKLIIICLALAALLWGGVFSELPWVVTLLDHIPGKYFLVFTSGLFIVLLGVVAYAYFYIPPVKGFLLRLHGTCVALGTVAFTSALIGLPDPKKFSFTPMGVSFEFFEPSSKVPMIALCIVCVFGILVVGFYYLIADWIERTARRRRRS
jgi:hypothetical protein